MVIGLDFDGVMNNMLETWLSWLNSTHGMNVRLQDIKQWELKEAFPTLTDKQLYAPLYSSSFWDQVPVMHEAPEVVEKLLVEGHKIFVVTTTHFDIIAPKLAKCLFKYFPLLSKKNVIVTYDKSLIRCDLLLDDAEHNLIDFTGIRVLFDASYNQHAAAIDYRVSSWKEFYILISELTSGAPRRPYNVVQQFKADRGQGKTAWLHQMIYDSTEGALVATNTPCYVIMPTDRYRPFCESYLKRFGKACPAKLFGFNQVLEHDARLFC